MAQHWCQNFMQPKSTKCGSTTTTEEEKGKNQAYIANIVLRPSHLLWVMVLDSDHRETNKRTNHQLIKEQTNNKKKETFETYTRPLVTRPISEPFGTRMS